jgi:formate dehydrogenase iron-sulfur subunit
MPVSRRDFLKVLGAGLGGAVLPSAPLQPTLSPLQPRTIASEEAAESASMLYDATLCVGCRACQTACKRRSDLAHVTDSENLYEMPRELSSNTWTIVKLYKGDEGISFVKHQCMHCIEPACSSVCPVLALEKLPSGPVIYNDYKCIGCRYCMAACPFGIPKYQWEKPLPLVQKCDFCADRQAKGQAPACTSSCPTGALVFGKRGQLLEVARQRIAEKPDFYVNRIYGEFEVGGTSALYLSHIPFEKVGFPALNDMALPQVTWPYMLAVPGIIVVMGSLMTAIYMRTHRNQDKEA